MDGYRVLHVAFSDDWEACARFGEYDVATRSTLVETTGFVHATTRDGLPAVLRDVYGDTTEPLLLAVVDEDALGEAGTPVTWAHVRPGAPATPRIGGVLPMDDRTVVAALELARGVGGWSVPDLTGLRVRAAAPEDQQ